MKILPTSSTGVAMLCVLAMLVCLPPDGLAQKIPPPDPGGGKPPDGGGGRPGGPRRLPVQTQQPTRAPQVIKTPPKIEFVQPRSPFNNALTGPDQTWGMTGITLINDLGDLNYRKTRGHGHYLTKKKKAGPEEFSVSGPRIEGDAQTYNPHKLTIPPDAIIIDTSDNLTGGGLVPIAYRPGAVENHPPIVVRVSAARSNLVLFNQDNQLSCGDISNGDKTLLMGSIGTTFSTTNKVVYLHAGRLLIDSANDPVRIATKMVGVKVEPGSTVLFEYWPSKPIRVMALAKHGPSAKVRISFISGAPISLEPGQELLISEGQIKPADLEPADGVERKVIDENRPPTGGEVVTRSFSVQQFAPQVLLSPAQVRACSSQKSKIYDRMLSHIGRLESLPKDSQSKSDTWSPDPVRMFAKDGTELMTESTGAVSLFSGTMLVKAPTGTRVRTDLGEIRVDDPAVLAVASAPGAVRVNTCDGQDAVWALTGRHRIELNPGTEMLLTDHTPSSEEAYAHDGVGRRKVTATQLPNGISVVLSDFSIMSLMSNGKHLKTLKKPDTPTDSQLVDHVLSTAAILNMTTASRGGYFAQPDQE